MENAKQRKVNDVKKTKSSKSHGGTKSADLMNTPLMQKKSQKASNITNAKSPIQKQETPNNTGLPDNLKSGIENLSGYDMSDVKVHYNSSKPAEMNAHAYAQGSDIHVASGQEKHLPHEAWHVVQQKQGRVKPTTQMANNGILINDDKSLEKEADVMGAKALQFKGKTPSKLNSKKPSAVAQKTAITTSKEMNKYFTTSWHHKIGIKKNAHKEDIFNELKKENALLTAALSLDKHDQSNEDAIDAAIESTIAKTLVARNDKDNRNADKLKIYDLLIDDLKDDKAAYHDAKLDFLLTGTDEEKFKDYLETSLGQKSFGISDYDNLYKLLPTWKDHLTHLFEEFKKLNGAFSILSGIAGIVTGAIEISAGVASYVILMLVTGVAKIVEGVAKIGKGAIQVYQDFSGKSDDELSGTLKTVKAVCDGVEKVSNIVASLGWEAAIKIVEMVFAIIKNVAGAFAEGIKDSHPKIYKYLKLTEFTTNIATHATDVVAFTELKGGNQIDVAKDGNTQISDGVGKGLAYVDNTYSDDIKDIKKDTST